MTDTEALALFERRRAGVDCPLCEETNSDGLLLELPSGRVTLQNDADYRGYCVLVFRRHAPELHALTSEERAQWIEDVSRIGQAISEVCAPAKLNVSMLGNLVPHLHAHVMPRYPTDPEWVGPPAFRSTSERRPLPPEEFAALHAALQNRLHAPI